MLKLMYFFFFPLHFKRDLSVIDESVSLLSDCDIYDKTEDDLECSYLRSGRKWKSGVSGLDIK